MRNLVTEPKRGRSEAPAARAFTLTELLVVIAVLAILAGLFGPARASATAKGKDLHCLNNTRQLIRAWQLYSSDNQDSLVMVFHGGDAQAGSVAEDPRKAPWTVGWLDWTTSADNTNVLFLTDDRYSRLASYLGRSKEVFKCPSDRYLSAAQRAKGWTERVRSYSVNIAVGDGNAEAGPWEPIYRHVKKNSDLIIPGPGQTYVFADEHPDSMNDPGLFNPHQTSWIDQPASYHNGSACFAFADGHSEMHKWVSSLAQARAQPVKFSNSPDAPAVAGDPDIHWVSFRSPRVTSKSY